MDKLAQSKVPHQPIPGRYVVRGYCGRKAEILHRWSKRSDAERNADGALEAGFSKAFEQRFTRVSVTDVINEEIVYERRADKKRYG